MPGHAEEAEELAAEAERRLRAAGDPARAAAQRAYLKSSREFAGVPVPATRRIIRQLVRSRPGLSGRDPVAIAQALWQRPLHECRLAATMVLADHAAGLGRDDAEAIERMIRESGTWALVDVLAASVMGPLAEREPGLGATLDRWAGDPDFWVRRAALLTLLGPLRRGEGDFARFSRYADAMLAEREFFIRKAIGWVLRDTARRRPGLVADWLAPRAHRASGVTLREAVKPLPPEVARRLLAARRPRARAGGAALS